MRGNFLIPAILIVANFFCSTGKIKNHEILLSLSANTMDSLCFEATIDTLFIGLIPDRYEYGIDYQNKVVSHLSDSCEIFVGIDANYQLSLSKIEYSGNVFNLDSANLLILHIHSPTQTFISAEKPEKGKRYYFKLLYRKKDNGEYTFIFLKANKKA